MDRCVISSTIYQPILECTKNTWKHPALGFQKSEYSRDFYFQFSHYTASFLLNHLLEDQTNMMIAFGIFVGYAADLAFYHVPDSSGITGLNWRLMMGSACLPAIIVVCFVFLCPESPRWYVFQCPKDCRTLRTENRLGTWVKAATRKHIEVCVSFGITSK